MKTAERLILGIETSCDDTSICVLRSKSDKAEILTLRSLNQDELLDKWGGVVPEISARQHASVLKPLFETVLKDTGLQLEQISNIAVTTSPGLIGSLMTGLHAAKSLSLLYEIPITPVHHLRAHLEIIHYHHQVPYPYVGLLVSGGHSQIYWCPSYGEFHLVGDTLDDAAGEAFDKGGKLLGLNYPAGREIDQLAQSGDPQKYSFPISKLKDRPGKMSFSGLKTALRQFLEKESSYNLSDVCASYQEAIIESLSYKVHECKKHLLPPEHFSAPLVVGGGVACNSRLRSVLKNHFNHVFFVPPNHCTDNAAMIAYYAHRYPQLTVQFPACLDLDAKSRG